MKYLSVRKYTISISLLLIALTLAIRHVIQAQSNTFIKSAQNRVVAYNSTSEVKRHLGDQYLDAKILIKDHTLIAYKPSGRLLISSICHSKTKDIDLKSQTVSDNSIAIDKKRILLGSSKHGKKEVLGYLIDADSGELRITIESKTESRFRGKYSGERFDKYVDLHHDYALIGVPRLDKTQNNSLGFAILFDLKKRQEVYRFRSPKGIFQRFGTQVALSDQYAVVYSPKDDPFRSYSSVYVYNLETKNRVFEAIVEKLESLNIDKNTVYIVQRRHNNSWFKYVQNLLLIGSENEALIHKIELNQESIVSEEWLSVNDFLSVTRNGYVLFEDRKNNNSLSAINLFEQDKLISLSSASRSTGETRNGICLQDQYFSIGEEIEVVPRM